MANTLLTPTAVTREALRILHQKLNFVGSITGVRRELRQVRREDRRQPEDPPAEPVHRPHRRHPVGAGHDRERP